MNNKTPGLSYVELVKDENKRNWPEDFEHENGNYMNSCIDCNQQFLGYKRRFLCKQCSNKPKT